MRSYRESMNRIAMPDALKERIRQQAALLENRPAENAPIPQSPRAAGQTGKHANGQTLPGRGLHRRRRWIWLAAQGAAACLLCLFLSQMQLSDWLLPAEKSTTQESSAGKQQAPTQTPAASQTGSGTTGHSAAAPTTSAAPAAAADNITGAPPLQANGDTPGFSPTLEPPHMDTAEPDAPLADNMPDADQDTPSRQQDTPSILDRPVNAPVQDSASQQQSTPSSQEQAQTAPPTSTVPETDVPSPAPSFPPDSAAGSESTSGGGGAAMGGGGGGAGGSTLVQGGSPFTEFASIGALQTACGFSFRYPRTLPEGCTLDSISLAYGEQVHLTYQGTPAFTFWVSTSAGLPRGQGSPTQMEIAGNHVTMYVDSGAVFGAFWTDGSLYYAIACNGLPLEQVRALIAGVA